MKTQRVLFGLLACVVFVAACGGDDGGTPDVKGPDISGLSTDISFPGDTVTISGSNFATPANNNSIRFSNPLSSATPHAGSSTQLLVIVDDNATDGPVSVTSNGMTDSGPSLEIQRSIGDVFVFGGLGANQTLKLPNPTATTRYLIIPHATSTSIPYNRENSYRIGSANNPPVAAQAASASGAGTMTVREDFDVARWESARELVKTVGTPRFEEPAPRQRATAVAQIRNFNVLKTTTGSVLSPSSYEQVQAQLRYNGTKCLVYTDTDTLANGNFSGSDLRELGQEFDNSIEATNVNFFGGYSDVNNDDKVILLISPVVNRLTPPGSAGFIAGFFLSVDLYSPPQVPTGTTNRAEVLYLLAADPTGFWGNSFSLSFAKEENIGTTAHELEHLISFSRRILVEQGPVQVTWLEEGMAHMAEDLNGDNRANEGRGGLYLEDPGAISLEHANAPLEQRGGIYLFLRLMVDRYGTDILKDIVQSKCTGRACVQDATGEGFYQLVAEFLSALYLSGRGITADPRYNYATLDLNDFGPLTSTVHVGGAGDVTGTVRLSSGDFRIFTGLLNNTSEFTFTDVTGSRLRHAVVRIQ